MTGGKQQRHALSTRLWHWLTLPCIVILFMSGLNISNAHPRLYWGEWGYAVEDAWLLLPRYPTWMTLPNYYSLGGARDWHNVAAWPFAVLLLLIWIAMLVNGHFKRDLTTSRAEWKPAAIAADFRNHLARKFNAHEGKYSYLQKLTYGLIFGVALPLMIITGMAMSPGMDAAWPFLSEMFGGRQSARSIHFLMAWAIMIFMVLHVVLVLIAGPWKLLRGMITGQEA